LSSIGKMSLDLKLGQVLRRQGMKKGAEKPELVAITKSMLEDVTEKCLLAPLYTYRILPIASIESNRILLKDGAIIKGDLLPSILSKSSKLVVIACTIGPRLENEATKYMAHGDTLRGLLLDGIGTAAIDELVIKTCKLMRLKAKERGLQASSPLCPGMPGLNISEQWNLFELLSPNGIGITLSSSGIMHPLKSSSAVIGIGPDMPVWTQAEVCGRCNLGDSCHYRIRTNDKISSKRSK